ncbi:TPA: Rz1-like lysis system protein LysC [Serratia marcescens]|uniref:Rz1-like lysis system protein LysC n=1 Tax=Serratia nevei TaxID=2703794 RepID=UPI003FA7D5A7
MKRLKTIPVPLSLCLALCLSSCARPPPPQAVPLLPPESVFAPCEQPQLQGETWGDSVSYTLALQTSLHICAGQVETLNAWRATLPPY